MAIFSDALRTAIEDSGFSLDRIATESGVHAADMHRFYHAERDLTLTMADRLAAYFRLVVSQEPQSKRNTHKPGRTRKC